MKLSRSQRFEDTKDKLIVEMPASDVESQVEPTSVTDMSIAYKSCICRQCCSTKLPDELVPSS